MLSRHLVHQSIDEKCHAQRHEFGALQLRCPSAAPSSTAASTGRHRMAARGAQEIIINTCATETTHAKLLVFIVIAIFIV